MNHYDLARICGEGYRRHTARLPGDIEYLIEDYQGATVIVPRGTEATGFWKNGGWMDIIRDVRFFPWRDSRVGWGHAGFMRAAQKIADDLGKYHLPGAVYIACHSLGAGIGVPLGKMLKANGLEVVEVVGFGAPRSLRTSAVKRYDVPCVLYRNGHDFVTTVPRRSWGYRHPVEMVQLGVLNGKRTWKDHPIDLYIEALST